MTQYLPPPDSAAQIRNLRVFAAVAAVGSVTGAAAKLFRAPSAITRSVLELERALGCALFERQPRGLLLTAAGQAVLVRAHRIEHETVAATADLRAIGIDADGPSASGLAAVLSTGRKLSLLSDLVGLGSISASAHRLGISQAGASMALGRIETMIGMPLFQRRPDGMAAGGAAERLSHHATRVFAELRHLESDLADLGGRIGGAVVVGTTPLGRTHVFTAAIADAATRHPDLRVVTLESNYPTLIDGLLHGEIDLVVGVLRPLAASGIAAEPLFVDHLALLLRAGHPLLSLGAAPTMADLIAERWILPRSMLLGRSFIEERFRTLGLPPPRPAIETGDPAIIRQLLTSTDMVAATSPFQLAPDIRAGTVVELPLRLPGAHRTVGLILRDGALLSPAAEAVASALRSRAAEQNGELHGGDFTPSA